MVKNRNYIIDFLRVISCFFPNEDTLSIWLKTSRTRFSASAIAFSFSDSSSVGKSFIRPCKSIDCVSPEKGTLFKKLYNVNRIFLMLLNE